MNSMGTANSAANYFPFDTRADIGYWCKIDWPRLSSWDELCGGSGRARLPSSSSSFRQFVVLSRRRRKDGGGGGADKTLAIYLFEHSHSASAGHWTEDVLW